MKPEEYVKTVMYNGYMINIGLDDDGQQYFLEYINDEGKLVEDGCGAYNTNYQKIIERLFGTPSLCVLYENLLKSNTLCEQYFAHEYCIYCPCNPLLQKKFSYSK